MYIRIKLPKEYSDLDILKTYNYPYRRSFSALMVAVANLAAAEDLSHYGVFGRIEHALAPGSQLVLPDVGSPVTLDYKELDETIIEFYEDAPMTNKQLTLMFVRLMLKLRVTIGDSVPEMIYLIENLERQGQAPLPAVAPIINTPAPLQVVQAVAEVPATPPAAPKATKKATKKAKQATKTEPKDIAKMVGVKKGTASVTPSPSPAAQAVHDKVSKLKDVVEDAAKAKPAEVKDDLFTRVEKLKEVAEDAIEGETVTRNPLMGDFFSED